MRDWIDLVAGSGVKFVQLLPINETGGDDSPYNAISSVALEPLFLNCDEVPGLEPWDIDAVRGNVSGDGRVDYATVRRVKWQLLELAWTNWGADDDLVEEFAEFRRAESEWLENYCAFRWLMAEAGGSEAWDHWPEAWREVTGARAHLAAERARDGEGVASRLAFFAWVQWLCFRQWRGVKSYADRCGVKLMGDIPIGVSRYSADVFFGREDFDLDWCGGAPPETLFEHDRFIQQWGQNWGIPLYRWGKMAEEDFPWWRQRIGKLTDVFHVFRIDHVLGFYRIYSFPWRPQYNDDFLDVSREQASEMTGGLLPKWSPQPDDTEEHRAENRADGDLRLRMILEAAGEAAVVGEDLGCVPDYVRPHLSSLGIAGFRVPQWDLGEEGHVVLGSDFPECSFATYATHDHEPLAAMWDGLWKLAVSDEETYAQEKAQVDLSVLRDFAGIEEEGPYDSEKGWKLIGSLMESKSRYAAIMATDLFGLPDRINQPGTVGPHNWTYRFPWSAEECGKRGEWRVLRRVLEEAGR